MLHVLSKPKPAWTCPMHPDIKTDAPGSCPACGMALVPVESIGTQPR
jgi:P-type Cu+ transporter